ncbi:MAG: helix-turn-helix domain-containing protein [Legionellales bacterium]|nr:helix-turn-helix domain-containing protein [Legionellales bacterium]
MAEKILTIKEVAAYLKVAEKSIYRLLAQEKFPGFKVGGTWRFRKSEIEHWINTQSIKMLDDKGSEDEKSE